jgi:hypothetical protein
MRLRKKRCIAPSAAVYSGRQKKLCANCGAWLGFAAISKEGNGVVHLMMTIGASPRQARQYCQRIRVRGRSPSRPLSRTSKTRHQNWPQETDGRNNVPRRNFAHGDPPISAKCPDVGFQASERPGISTEKDYPTNLEEGRQAALMAHRNSPQPLPLPRGGAGSGREGSRGRKRSWGSI